MARLFTKRDEDFLLFLRMGAEGTRKVKDYMAEQANGGHDPQILDRGALVPKIWKERIKRLRVPDLFCLRCGKRVEVRSKSTPMFTMSHSQTQQGREWDSGLREDDYVAFVVIEQTDGLLRANNLVQFVQVGDMQRAQRLGLTKRPPRKAASEAAEGQIEWPAAFARESGKVIKRLASGGSSVDRLIVRYDDSGKNAIIRLERKRTSGSPPIRLTPLVDVGEQFVKYQALASVVQVVKSFKCETELTVEDYMALARERHPALQHTGVRALGLLGNRAEKRSGARKLLRSFLDGQAEPLVKVEAALSLASLGDQRGVDWLQETLASSATTTAMRFECVHALAEVGNAQAVEVLTHTLQSAQEAGIRAAAAWALGHIKPALEDERVLRTLIATFSRAEDPVREEAVRALSELLDSHLAFLLEQLDTATSQDERAGVAWAIGHGKGSQVVRQVLEWILKGNHDNRARIWAAYVLAVRDVLNNVNDVEMMAQLEKTEPDLYFAVTVLAQIMRSWIYRLGDVAQ